MVVSAFRIGQQLGEGHPRVIVDGHMQGEKAAMHASAAQPAVAAQGNVGEAGHGFDIEMQEVARSGVLVAHHGRRRVEIAPSAQPRSATLRASRRGLRCGRELRS
jgi:hypothetical protein